MSKNNEPLVVQYESKSNEEEYSQFWKGRDYEDRSERQLLNKILKTYPSESAWLVDIGGSFGRLLDLYSTKFKKVAIADYATNQFHLSLKPAKKNKVNLTLMAANAFHMPFADASQPAIISIRVMHHLVELPKFFEELDRVLVPGGVAIIEAANKNHIKNWFKCLFKADFSDWRKDWIDLGKSGLQDDDKFLLIRDHKPAYMRKVIRGSGLKLKRQYSISWLRRTPFANMPIWFSGSIEKLMQAISPNFMLAPSCWYIVQKPGSFEPGEVKFKNTLVDPATKKPISAANQKKVTKDKNGASYLDLRHPKPRI